MLCVVQKSDTRGAAVATLGDGSLRYVTNAASGLLLPAVVTKPVLSLTLIKYVCWLPPTKVKSTFFYILLYNFNRSSFIFILLMSFDR